MAVQHCTATTRSLMRPYLLACGVCAAGCPPPPAAAVPDGHLVHAAIIGGLCVAHAVRTGSARELITPLTVGEHRNIPARQHRSVPTAALRRHEFAGGADPLGESSRSLALIGHRAHGTRHFILFSKVVMAQRLEVV